MKLSESFTDKRIVITGGLGFIGATLAHRLVEGGACVTIVDSLIPEYGGNRFNIDGFDDRVRVNIADVRDQHAMRALLQGQEILFNLAGQTSHMDSMKDPMTDLEINSRAQLSILECCRQFNPTVKVVFASTRQIYGRPEYLPVDERHPLRPVDVNGINKIAGESYHILYNEVYGIPTCVLRLTNTIGPRMRIKDARQTFVGIWIRNLVEGKPFEVWGGTQKRDFNDVDDVVDALLLAATTDAGSGKIFNLGGPDVVTLSQLADLMIELNGGGEYVVRQFPEDRKRIDIGDFYGNYNAAKVSLGWQPRATLRDTLARTIAYYRKHLDHYV